MISTLMGNVIQKIEQVTVIALQILTILLVLGGTVVLFVLFGRHFFTRAAGIGSITDLLPAMQESFAGILIVLLGLELLGTLKTYFRDHHVRLEVILVVAIIAVGRHVIQIDFDHTPGVVLLGLAAVIVSLTVGYFLVKKAQILFSPEEPKPAGA